MLDTGEPSAAPVCCGVRTLLLGANQQPVSCVCRPKLPPQPRDRLRRVERGQLLTVFLLAEPDFAACDVPAINPFDWSANKWREASANRSRPSLSSREVAK